jgi:hypothetical protein
METKFTKGEWIITDICIDHKGAGYYRIGTNEQDWIAEAKGTHVGAETSEECLANAKLIAAAPEMFETLELIKSMCDNKLAGKNHIWAVANSALKKATE